MTFILFNEFIGDAMVDAFLPAMYSSVFFLGAFLYTLSIAALLVTFCFLLAIANYWAFVYNPASQAHSKRKLKLKRLSRDGPPVKKATRIRSTYPTTNIVERSKSFFSPLASYFVRVFHIVKRSVQHGITLFSFRRIRHTKMLAAQRVWCGMNRPLALQGMVQVSKKTRTTSMRTRRGGLHRKSSTHLVPDCVTGMAASSSMRTQQLVKAQSGYRHFEESVDQADLSEDPVVTRTGGMFKARRILAPRILFQAKQVFNHLRFNLADSVDRHDEALEVSEDLLSEEVRKVLDIFYPDGIAFTAAEKTEAYDLFESWKESVSEQFVLKLTKNSIDVERVIRFSLFEKWFTRDITSVIHNTMSDRLMESPMVTSVNVTNTPGNRNSAMLRVKHTASDLRLNT